jgi:flagellar basal body rod protein FlgC
MSTEGMSVSIRAAQAQAARLESVAHNLANLGTPGFAPSRGAFRARLEVALSSASAPRFELLTGVGGRPEVNPLEEMAELTKSLRALEANLSAFRLQDAALGRAVNELPRIPR